MRDAWWPMRWGRRHERSPPQALVCQPAPHHVSAAPSASYLLHGRDCPLERSSTSVMPWWSVSWCSTSHTADSLELRMIWLSGSRLACQARLSEGDAVMACQWGRRCC